MNRKLDVCLALFGPTNNSKNTNESSNKLIKVQRYFYSTKRKRQTTNIRIAKPSREKKNEITSLLMKGQPKINKVLDEHLRK